MTRVAAIDCGTNTLRLLIADADEHATPQVATVVREMRTVRLGEGLETTGEFSAAALARTEDALAEYAVMIQNAGVQAIRMVATSASRDVGNRDRLIEMAQRLVGVTPEVISGAEEGRLTFRGVRSGLSLSGPSIVVDIGGGSTELIVGDGDDVRAEVSMRIGVVRLTERYMRTDPPAAAELALVADATRESLSAALAELGPVEGYPLIGVAGTATTAAAIALGLASYDPRLIHGSRTAYADIERVRDWSYAKDTAGRLRNRAMHPGRAAVFPAGMAILDVVMRELHATELIVSESDILDGIALSIAGAY